MSEFLQDLDPRTIDPNELDSRISFDQTEEKWIFEDPVMKEEFEFNEELERWIPTIPNNDEAITDAQREIQEKRKQRLKELKEQKETKLEQKRPETAIYVSNLPKDIDLAELNHLFSKFGVISVDLLTNKPKIKLYRDDEGSLKGDALIIYVKQESVNLAIQMLDETKLRPGNELIRVQKANFDNKESDSKKREFSEEDRKIIKKRLKQLNNKIEDWNGDDDTINPKWLRTVILKRVFTLKELQEDPLAKDEIIEDILDGCEELGQVEKIILFDQEEEGVVLVRFGLPEAATKCIDKMDGRFFGGQKLIATRYNGEQYSKTDDPQPVENKEHGNEEDERRFNDYINDVTNQR